MDDRVLRFVEQTAQTIVGLDIALFYQENPNTFDTSLGIAMRTHRGLEEVEPALERLAMAGVLERHERGDGKYTCYALARDTEMWNILCLLSEAYIEDFEARKEIVRILVKLRQGKKAADQRSSTPGGEQN